MALVWLVAILLLMNHLGHALVVVGQGVLVVEWSCILLLLAGVLLLASILLLWLVLLLRLLISIDLLLKVTSLP